MERGGARTCHQQPFPVLAPDAKLHRLSVFTDTFHCYYDTNVQGQLCRCSSASLYSSIPSAAVPAHHTMSYIKRRFTQLALLHDRARLLYEDHEAAKKDRDAPFQQRRSELKEKLRTREEEIRTREEEIRTREEEIRTREEEIRTLEEELRTLEQNREAASKEVEQRYKPKFDELTWFLPQHPPDQAAESPVSPNAGRPGVRKGRNTCVRLSGDDGSGHDDVLADDDNGLVYNDGQPRGNGSQHRDNDDGSNFSDGEAENEGGSDSDNSSTHNHNGPSNSPRSLRKRKPARVASDFERPEKRHRGDRQTASSSSAKAREVEEVMSNRTEETISFEEAFRQYRIVPWPASSHNFYILRCSLHGKTFNSKDPIQGAGKHLNKIHGVAGTHDNAVKELGVRVQNCTREQVDESNRAIDPPQQRLAGDRKTSIQPVSGRFYQIYWHGGAKIRSGTRSSTPFIALCLPTGSFDAVGMPGSIYDTDLVRSIPVCYRTHTRTMKILGWNDDYQDGGTKASQRKFPFMFFTNDIQLDAEGRILLPRKGKIFSWVAANHVQPLDLNDSNTSHLPGHATALAFESRLLHQPEPSSATVVNDQSDSNPLSNAGHDDGSGDQSQAGGGQGSASLPASTSEPSANAEQPAAATFRSGPAPEPSGRANNSTSSPSTSFDNYLQGLFSQVLNEDADTAKNGPTPATHLPSNSEDNRPESGTRPESGNRPGSENRPSREHSRPNFESNKPRPEDTRQDIRAEAAVGVPQSEPVSNGQGRDIEAERGSLSYILGTSSVGE
ncbi:hypothetical protein MAPG_11311 [Magnaporthiopsis poae ATCC 64411]|uniref:Uncharacterized protein n=1 Tax=Magnaporthiopsis poae (strain ATCC 64411 / 73-15) TaxID=644358 RepID=A0A0C4EEX9_MAGP6|nr:hypothetical protein MAPG_11311 [Magnaporthiopsis poae ATCC 64411]